MSKRFSGKSVLITGAGSGIGRATALAFADEGARLAVCDVSEQGGQGTVRAVQERGAEAFFVRADVSKSADCAAMVEQTLARYGRLDVAFNNAGINIAVAPTAEIDESEWARLLAINLTGVFLSMKYEIPAMKRGGGGVIVNTASVGGLIGTAGIAPYCASKHGVVGLTRSAALEYIKEGIRINAICPGGTRTPMLEEWFSNPEIERSITAQIPSGRICAPEEIARAVLFLASDDSSYMVGHPLTVDGGLTIQ
jgi:NAD(P)-dependent dehydrogenase (short-subunit alcohol dehydrogenase family)